MKEFLVGLLFLLAVALMSGVGLLLFPLVIVLAFFLRIILMLAFVVLCIWLLGKFIVFIWEKLKEK